MSKWMVRYIGHLDVMRRPAGFPEEVSDFVLVEANNKEELAALINKNTSSFIAPRGMLVNLFEGTAIHSDQIDLNKIFLPMEMFDYIYTMVYPITGPMPSFKDEKLWVGGQEVKPL